MLLISEGIILFIQLSHHHYYYYYYLFLTLMFHVACCCCCLEVDGVGRGRGTLAALFLVLVLAVAVTILCSFYSYFSFFVSCPPLTRSLRLFTAVEHSCTWGSDDPSSDRPHRLPPPFVSPARRMARPVSKASGSTSPSTGDEKSRRVTD